MCPNGCVAYLAKSRPEGESAGKRRKWIRGKGEIPISARARREGRKFGYGRVNWLAGGFGSTGNGRELPSERSGEGEAERSEDEAKDGGASCSDWHVRG